MLLLFILTTCFAVASTLPAQRRYDDRQRVIYTLSNNPDGNNILSLSVSSDGTLSSPVLTPTGGKGLLGLSSGPKFGPTGLTVGSDGLFSQGSVVVFGNVRLCQQPAHYSDSLTIPSRHLVSFHGQPRQSHPVDVRNRPWGVPLS